MEIRAGEAQLKTAELDRAMRSLADLLRQSGRSCVWVQQPRSFGRRRRQPAIQTAQHQIDRRELRGCHLHAASGRAGRILRTRKPITGSGAATTRCAIGTTPSRRREKSVSLDAKNSLYHVWLGREYGGKADRDRSFSLAKKVKNEFKEAVSLTLRISPRGATLRNIAWMRRGSRAAARMKRSNR